MIRVGLIGLLFGVCSAVSAVACPLDQLSKLSDQRLDVLRAQQVPVESDQSLEGGIWSVYFRADGSVHSIVRTDFGEMGKREMRVTFLDLHNFTIGVTVFSYKAPIGTASVVEILDTSSKTYFFCEADDVVYVPVNPRNPKSAPADIEAASSLKAEIFEAPEISSYIQTIH